MDKKQILINNLDKSYSKVTRNPVGYFNSIRCLRSKRILVDANLFFPLDSQHILHTVFGDNGLLEHRLYGLSVDEMISGSQFYKEELCRLLEYKQNIFVSNGVKAEVTAEEGHWQGTIEHLGRCNFIIKDSARRGLFDKLIRYGETHLSYLKESDCVKITKDIVHKRILRSSDSEFGKNLRELLESADVRCSETDRALVHTALVNCFEENLTLVSEDYHLSDLVENIRNNKRRLERLTDTKIKIERTKKFWHGFITYVFNFCAESTYS